MQIQLLKDRTLKRHQFKGCTKTIEMSYLDLLHINNEQYLFGSF
jgi:hypothetical protein